MLDHPLLKLSPELSTKQTFPRDFASLGLGNITYSNDKHKNLSTEKQKIDKQTNKTFCLAGLAALPSNPKPGWCFDLIPLLIYLPKKKEASGMATRRCHNAKLPTSSEKYVLFNFSLPHSGSSDKSRKSLRLVGKRRVRVWRGRKWGCFEGMITGLGVGCWDYNEVRIITGYSSHQPTIVDIFQTN